METAWSATQLKELDTQNLVREEKVCEKSDGPTRQQQIMNCVYPTNTHPMTFTHSLTWPPTQQTQCLAFIKEH